MAQHEFSISEDFLQEEFNAYPEELAKPPSVAILDMVAAINAARLGADISFARNEIERLGTTFLDVGNRTRANQLVHQDFKESVNKAIEVSSIPDIVAAEERRLEGESFAEKTKSPEVYALARDQGGELFKHEEARAAARYATLLKIIDETIEGEEVSFFSILGDIADIFVSAPVDALRLGGFKRTEEAQRLRALITADIPEEEFELEARRILESANDTGILQDSNFLFLLSQAQNLEELGEGIEGTLEQIGTTADLVSLGGFAASKALRGLSVARNTTALTGALAGPRAAERVLSEAVRAPGTTLADNAGVPRELSPTLTRHPESFGTEFAWTAPGSHIAAEVEKQNTFLNVVRSLKFSRRIDPEVLNEWAPEGLRRLSERIDANSHNRVLNMSINVDDQDNIFGTITYGRADGLPFGQGRGASRAGRGSAQKLANQIGGTVRTITRGGQDYFVVDVTHNLPSTGLARPLDNNEIGTSFLRAFGGTFLTIPKRLDALAKRGEGVAAIGIKRIADNFKTAIKGVNTEERRVVEQIFYDMRDGDRLSNLRQPLTLPEFRSEWARYSDTPPSPKAEELYLKIQELNDALYFLKADDIFKRTVNEGFGEVINLRFARQDGTLDEFNLISKRVRHQDVNDTVINPITGESWEVGNIPEGKNVFQVLGGYKVGDQVAKYITLDQPTIRRLYHSDVLGYNPGGPRAYEFLNHAVKQETEVELLSGRKVAGRPRTILGTATRQEAEIAVNEINSIFKAARERIPNLVRMPLAKAISAIESLGDEFDEIVALNNAWNTSIETTADLVDFLRKQQIHPGKNVGAAAMDAPLAIADDADILWFPFGKESTHRDLFDWNVNNPRNSRRRDKPLLGFGGTQAATRSPLDTIQNDFIRTMHSRAFGAYNFQAVTGWLKGAAPHILNRNEIAGLDPLQAMRKADFGPKPTREAENYMAARDAIERTLGTQTEYEKMWNAKMDRIAEWVYDKGKKKTALAIMRNSKNPLEFLRGWSFDARLGMLSPDQLIVQSSQAINILAIIGPRRIPEWLQATATHWPIRLAMETDSEEVIRAIGRRTAAFTGMSEDEFLDFARWTKESGRLIVGGEVAEISAVSPVLARGMFSKARMGARFFFNEGEKFPRSVALRVAWNEYKKQFPKADPFSDHGINWISSRQDALTAAMTRASAARWQKGPLSIPFQFLSYITRMMESLFTDRLLTKAERRRLASAQVVFWGAAGTGFGSFLDAYILENGLEMSQEEYTALRYGILDSIIQAAFGGQAVIGGRLAPAEGIAQLIENWNDSNFVEIVGGPSFALIQDTGLVLWQGMMDMLTGNTSMVEADLKKFLHHISSADDLMRAWAIYNTGDYISRNGDTVVSGLTNTDALLTLIGFQIEEVNLQYSRFDVMRDQNQTVRRYGKRIAEIMREYNRAVEDKDFEKAKELQKMIGGYLQKIPPYAQDQIKRELAGDIGTVVERTLGAVLERGYGTVNRTIETETVEVEE